MTAWGYPKEATSVGESPETGPETKDMSCLSRERQARASDCGHSAGLPEVRGQTEPAGSGKGFRLTSASKGTSHPCVGHSYP